MSGHIYGSRERQTQVSVSVSRVNLKVPAMNANAPRHSLGTLHGISHKVRVKYRPGINLIAFLQFMCGLMMLSFEAICVVLYRVADKDFLYGVEYLGMVVGLSCMVCSVIGRLSTRRTGPHALRMCFHVLNIIFTVFLSVETFAMAAISAALLALYTISWDSILAFVNRVSQTVELNLSVGTTTTTARTVSISPQLAAELAQDLNLLVGLRCVLFALYVLIFVGAVVSSCFSCCNYCKCWIKSDERRPSHTPTEAHIDAHHAHHHPPLTRPHVRHETDVSAKGQPVVARIKQGAGVHDSPAVKTVVEAKKIVVKKAPTHTDKPAT